MSTKLQTLARWYEERLEQSTRHNGTPYWKFRDEDKASEARCRALALAAHDNGSILPDDWRYAFISEALSALAETSDPDDCEIEADIYTADLTSWLGSRNDRSSYCDEAVSEGLIAEPFDLMARISAGQWMEKREVLAQVRDYLEGELTNDDGSEED